MITFNTQLDLLKILKEEKLAYGDYIVPVMIFFKRYKRESYKDRDDILNHFLTEYTNKNLI